MELRRTSLFIIVFLVVGGAVSGNPSITIQNPQNNSYGTSSSMNLNWTTNETLDWAGYSLDKASNVSLMTKVDTTQEDDTEDSYSYSGTIKDPGYGVDENWNSYARCNYPASGACYIYENYTNIPSWVDGVNWTAKAVNFGYGPISSPRTDVYCYNYITSSWEFLSVSASGISNQTYNLGDCFNGSDFKIRTNFICIFGSCVDYYEGKATLINYTYDNTTLTSLSDGKHNITTYGNNSAGQLGNSGMVYFTVDTSAPTTTATAIKNDSSSYTFNSWTNSSYVNVTLSCSDGSGIGCNVTLYCTDTSNSCSPNTVYSSPVKISTENTSYIRYKSNDTLGNDESTNTQTIKIDTTYPSIYYNANTDTSGNYSRNHIFINITASDTSKDTVKLYWNGSPENFQSSSGNLYWSNKTGLIDGNRSFYAWINDSAGWTNQTLSRTVETDTTYPTITFDSGTENDGTYFNRNWIYVNWTFTEANLQNITARIFNSTDSLINQTNFTTTTYEINWTLADLNEEYKYNITICDVVGYCNQTETRTLTLDDTIPTIILHTPSNDSAMNNTTPQFNFTVIGANDSYSCELFINNTGYGVNDWCYQETANESTTCGGLSTGDYSYGVVYDYPTPPEDWLFFYVNYTKPDVVTTGTRWQVKHGTLATYNITIPSSCWNAFSDILKLGIKVHPAGGGAGSETQPICWNGTSWQEIGTQCYYSAHQAASGSNAWTNLWDGNWSSFGEGYAGGWILTPAYRNEEKRIYEEGMWWWLSTQNNTPTIITANTSISDGTYNWYINCTDGGLTSQSAIRNITIDTTPPLVTINKPTSNQNFTNLSITLNITVSDLGVGVDSCQYSLDNFTSNTSFDYSIENTITSNEGKNILWVVCNDTLTNENNTESVTFYSYTKPIWADPTPPTGNYTENSHVFLNLTLNSSAENATAHINGSDLVMERHNATWFSLNYSFASNGTLWYNASAIMSPNLFNIYSETRTIIANVTTPDTTPPDIFNLRPISGTSYGSSTSTVYPECDTNEPASCKFDILDRNFSLMNYTYSTTGSTSHSTTFSVSAGNSYTLYTRCNDTSGNVNNISSNTTFSVDSVADDNGGGGGGGGDTIVIILLENITKTINVHPSLALPVLSEKFRYKELEINLEIYDNTEKLIFFNDSEETDLNGVFVYQFPPEIRSIRIGGNYSLIYFFGGTEIQRYQLRVISEFEQWGVLPKFIVYKFPTGEERRCTPITVFMDKAECGFSVVDLSEFEATIVAEKTSLKSFDLCVSDVVFGGNDFVNGNIQVLSSCYSAPSYVMIRCVKTECPDFGIPFLVGSVVVSGYKLCVLYYGFLNIIMFGVALIGTSYAFPKQRKRRLDWMKSGMGIVLLNVIILLV